MDKYKITMQRKNKQLGFTLIELLVAMVISLVIAIAALSTLNVSRQGFSTVDAASQLRENSRFATDMIQRLGVQAGFKDLKHAATKRGPPTAGVATDPPPNVKGFNNAELGKPDPLNSYTERAGTDGGNSDVLILQHQSAETFPGSGVSDLSMINCAGTAIVSPPTNRDDRSVSILHLAISKGEPSLMCSVSTGADTWSIPQPLISGVESFQVLYGVDNVTPGIAPAAGSSGDSVADRFLNASQLVVPGDAAGTNANWRRVRSIRIGMVLRAKLNSSSEVVSRNYFPLGAAPGSVGGLAGSAMSSDGDPGTTFIAPTDSRLRQVVTFTIHLRNDQTI
jgi:type IV pilus assembly protein PilW